MIIAYIIADKYTNYVANKYFPDCRYKLGNATVQSYLILVKTMTSRPHKYFFFVQLNYILKISEKWFKLKIKYGSFTFLLKDFPSVPKKYPHWYERKYLENANNFLYLPYFIELTEFLWGVPVKCYNTSIDYYMFRIPICIYVRFLFLFFYFCGFYSHQWNRLFLHEIVYSLK